MNEHSHSNIILAAFNRLPVDYRKELAPFEGLMPLASIYPDEFDTPNKPAAEKAKIDPQWARFTYFPKGFDAPTMHSWPHPREQQDKWIPMTSYLMDQAIAAHREKDLDGFVKFVGCLSHLLGDMAQPAHLMDLALLGELMPLPPTHPNFHFHTDVEAVVGISDELQEARVLGRSVEEAAWRLARIIRRMITECRGYLIPTIQALFADNRSEAERLAGPPVTAAAQATLDVMYTLQKLARRDLTANDRQTLSTVDLRLWPADAESHDKVYAGALLDANRQVPPWNGPRIPARLRMPDGEIRPVQGLGMLPHSGAEGPREAYLRFNLTPRLFDHFEAFVGMHADLTRDGGAVFEVLLDDKVVYQSDRRTATDPALAVRVPLGVATSITLKVLDPNEGRTFWNNHAFWVNPRLTNV